MYTLGVSVEFDSAHRLFPYSGKCANIHGHRYRLEVSVTGMSGGSDYVVDFGDLKKHIKDFVDSEFDHKLILNFFDPIKESVCDLGVEVHFLGKSPTAETLAHFIYICLSETIPVRFDGVRVEKVRLYETPTCYAEVGCEK